MVQMSLGNMSSLLLEGCLDSGGSGRSLVHTGCIGAVVGWMLIRALPREMSWLSTGKTSSCGSWGLGPVESGIGIEHSSRAWAAGLGAKPGREVYGCGLDGG